MENLFKKSRPLTFTIWKDTFSNSLHLPFAKHFFVAGTVENCCYDNSNVMSLKHQERRTSKTEHTKFYWMEMQVTEQ